MNNNSTNGEWLDIKKGIETIEKQGVYVDGLDGDFETPLVSGKECA